MIYLGIDPGKKGAIAWTNGEARSMRVVNMPKTPAESCDQLDELDKDVTVAALEWPKPFKHLDKPVILNMMPLIAHAGMWEGVLAAAFIPTRKITSAQWHRALGVSGGDKHAARAMAQQLFPHLKATLQNADAILIAEWLRRSYQVVKGIAS